MKRIAWIVGCLLLFSLNAEAVNETPLPEAKALIGMKLSISKGWVVPGWNLGGSYSLVAGKEELGVDVLDQGNVTIFITHLLDKADMSKTILDAHELPQDFFAWKIVNGKVVPKRKDAYTNPNYYNFNARCKSDDYETVVGIVRRQPGVSMGLSEDVKRAWAIDQKAGRITKISPKGVSCFVETGQD